MNPPVHPLQCGSSLGDTNKNGMESSSPGYESRMSSSSDISMNHSKNINEINCKNMNTSMKSKLALLSERISGFEKQMEQETRQRKESEEIRISAIREAITKLERTLAAEIKRRVEANKALETMFENQITGIQDRLEAIFGGKLDSLQKIADALIERINNAENDFAIEKQKFQQTSETKQQKLMKDISHLQNTLENEKSSRYERENQLIKRFGELESQLDQRIEVLKNFRESKYHNIAQAFERTKVQRDAAEEKFQSYLLEEIAGIKNGLVLESQARENADDDLVMAVNHYTQALQDALRLVSTS